MTTTTWQKLEIECAFEMSENIATYFNDLTGCGVEIRDHETGRSDVAVIVAYLDSEALSLQHSLTAARCYLQDLADLFPEHPSPILRQAPVADEDWGRKWKENFKPFKLTDTLVIKPTWESYSPKNGEKIIEIDPGMAFGTGLHASTRLAASLIEEHITSRESLPERVLDIGTGTGILAICCACLGCKNVIAIDNDPDAVAASVENISANNLTENIEAEITGLDSLEGPFDLVIANIIHNTLVEMAPTINGLLARNGSLIMAGILAGDQSRNISGVYDQLGIRTESERISGEWSALRLQKTIQPSTLPDESK
ncbi:MAG: 50S ribosomal protein L11 methyltransferase [Proteobacteria bacterium]|nr:50S ribosomal protein L11 methyltransferase [Pseudomonadota bacterium]MBU1739629.1 50S ribosomal protein L11 methyltransferase [Pseudomonadota bacterium]